MKNWKLYSSICLAVSLSLTFFFYQITFHCREKESQLSNASEINKQQKNQAEKALAELKRQIEVNSNKLYDDMKEQVCSSQNKKTEEKRNAILCFKLLDDKS